MKKKIILKLSDRILIVIFFFSTLLFFAAKFIFTDSIQKIFIFGGVVYIMTFLATYFLSKQFSKRIINLAFKVEEMAAGDFSKQLIVNQKDEIGQLANSLNELLKQLQTKVAIDVSKDKEIAQAKTDFVAIASHQLRTPLSIVKWYVDFLISEDAGKVNDEQKKYLKEIFKSNERLIELVNALLDVSRIDVGTFSIEPEPTDIIERAERALSRYYLEIEKKKIVLEKYYDQFPKLNLDPRLTKIVFENIISNAIKYTPEGGRIKIEIKKTDKNVLIKISDTGCGIPREVQPKMFTKLFRADNAKKIESSGTGLGLYIVKGIIEKSGGKIWFESPSLDNLIAEEEKNGNTIFDKEIVGTTFFITIPLKGMKPKKGTKKLNSID